MSAVPSLTTFESLASSPKIPVSAGEPLPGDLGEMRLGIVVLDFDIGHFFKSSIAGHFSLLFNELGLPSGDVDAIFVMSLSDSDFDELGKRAEAGELSVLYDFTGKLDALVPAGSIAYQERGSFKNDSALEWRYAGDTSLIDPHRLAMFSSAARVSFELAFMRSIFGHVETKDLSPMGDGLYERAKDVFDAVLVGFAEFPMSKEQVDDMLAYLLFMEAHKDTSPRPLTPSAGIVPLDDELREYGHKLSEASKLAHGAIELWDAYSRTSGAGILPFSTLAHSLRDPNKMPLDATTRRGIASVIGVESALDALSDGVPLMDLLA